MTQLELDLPPIGSVTERKGAQTHPAPLSFVKAAKPLQQTSGTGKTRLLGRVPSQYRLSHQTLAYFTVTILPRRKSDFYQARNSMNTSYSGQESVFLAQIFGKENFQAL